jgi:peptidyl-prolyl cis-trans isomerase A (cyclophilin A)
MRVTLSWFTRQLPESYLPVAASTFISGLNSMARDGVGTANSEFFICIGDQPALDYGETRNADRQGFAAFGQVVSGMEVVRRIHGLPSGAPTDDPYVEGQILEAPAVILTMRRQ